MRLIPLLAALGFLSNPSLALESSLGNLQVREMADGLDTPWAFGFLPSGSVLITERDGRLLRLDEGGGIQEVPGLGEVAAVGQGGLLDILVPRAFEQTRTLYFTYAKPQAGDRAGTSVAMATLAEDETRLTGWEVIFEMTPGSSGGRHFGSRIVEAADGTLFFTIGDRGDRPSAQDLSRHSGSVIRIAPDGGVPQDNPFAGQPGAQPEIWSYGHRNPQAAAIDTQGRLWVVEHGAQGGDEVNLVRKGANYGWPVISYGQHYSGGTIGEGTHKDGMEQPEFYWDPSIAPSGATFYNGALLPQWEGDLFVGSLKFDYISRLSGDPLKEVEKLQSPETQRVRDIREGPDGALWFLSVGQGALYRLAPE
jgi:glucose/arabinose dehydrogenase